MLAVIENHVHKEFIESAIADGWKDSNGPWGYNERHDLSVTLTKHFPELGGSVRLWMIHRNIGQMTWNKTESRWVNSYPENGWFSNSEAWLRFDTGGEEALDVKLEELLQNGLNENYWETLAHTCDNCGKVVDHVNHVAFANKACDECAPEMCAKLERPGWAN